MPDAVQMAQRPVDLRCSPVGEPRMSCAAARVVERKSTDEFGRTCACGELTRLFAGTAGFVEYVQHVFSGPTAHS